MELIGIIKEIEETKTFGSNDFKVRNILLETKEKYPQKIQIAFQQKNCELVNDFSVGDEAKVNINIRGREWTNKEGVTKYINTIVGWRIQHDQVVTLQNQQPDRVEPGPLPF